MAINFSLGDKQTLEDAFPKLRATHYTIRSPVDIRYNCHAYAMGETHRVWEPTPVGPSAFWPPGAPRAFDLQSFQDAYVIWGFIQCSDGELESGVRKIALYVSNNAVQHTAGQTADGSWISKLGGSFDLVHELNGLEGPLYGQVSAFMKKVT